MRVRKRRLRCQWAACSAASTRGEGGGVEALALHLVEELGEALGELEGGGAGGEVRLGLGERRDQAGELELAAERRDGGGEAGAEGVVGELGDGADARQEAGGALGEDRRERAGGAAGVEPDLHARDRLGRLAGEAGVEAGGQRAGEVDAGGQREDAGAVGRREEAGHRASSASASAMPSGRPTSTQPPAWTMPRSSPLAMRRVPDRVEREDAGAEAGEGGGVDDLGAGIDEGRGGGVGAAAEAGARRGRSRRGRRGRWRLRAGRGRGGRRRRLPGGGEGGEGVRAGPDHVGVEGEDGAGAEERQGALQAAAGLEEDGLVRDERRRGRCGRGGPASARRGRGC